jgi:hypothetical protein
MSKKHRSQGKGPRARGGSHKFPLATVAFYGPDDRKATKVAVAIITKAGAEPAFLERWFSEDADVRNHPRIGREIAAFLESHNVANVAMADRIIGCPHEEGKDYPLGQICPHCPFWEGRDRWTGLMVN